MNAYTCNAKCAPSRSSIVTGRDSWQLEEAANHWAYFPAKFKPYAEVLMENGYFVGHTAKGWGPGVALDSNGVNRQLTGPAFNEFKTEPHRAYEFKSGAEKGGKQLAEIQGQFAL
jgi:N-sulfoglucosamine sulfohydrolase